MRTTLLGDLAQLVGRTVQSVAVGDRDTYLRFETDQGPLFFESVPGTVFIGWFASLEGIKALLGHKVLTADASFLEVEGTRYEEIHTRFHTPAGEAKLVFCRGTDAYDGAKVVAVSDPGANDNEIYWEWLKEDWKPLCE